MKVSELQGAALDWAVAKCEGKNGVLHDDGITRCIVIAAASGVYKGTWKPTVNWSQGGPIIEREGIMIERWVSTGHWQAANALVTKVFTAETPLIAAMRCYCCSKLGDEVDVPEELSNVMPAASNGFDYATKH